MRKKAIILSVVLAVFVLVGFLLFSREESERTKAAIGHLAPQFELTDLQGKKINLRDYRGKVVLVNFWATWCETCKEESPLLQKLVNDEKGNSQLTVLKILFRDSKSNAELYIKKNKFNFTVLFDDKHTAFDYGVTGVPETFVISKTGILRHKFIGPVRWDMPDIRTLIGRLISEE
jgi:DsbE subfamily thiol:disulfide oxidoreductase